jgi:hypothetical protein
VFATGGRRFAPGMSITRDMTVAGARAFAFSRGVERSVTSCAGLACGDRSRRDDLTRRPVRKTRSFRVEESSLPFDRILFVGEGGDRQLTIEAFLALPVSERVKHLLAKDICFLRGDLEVDRRLCLRALMRLARR